MKKLALILSIVLLPIVGMPVQAKHVKRHHKVHTTMVYICTGPYASVYHSTPNCSGLNRCSGNIVKVSLKHARAMGRRACSKCY